MNFRARLPQRGSRESVLALNIVTRPVLRLPTLAPASVPFKLVSIRSLLEYQCKRMFRYEINRQTTIYFSSWLSLGAK